MHRKIRQSAVINPSDDIVWCGDKAGVLDNATVKRNVRTKYGFSFDGYLGSGLYAKSIQAMGCWLDFIVGIGVVYK